MNNAFDGQPCRPNGFGFCQQHQTCDHVTASLREAQVDAETLREENCKLRRAISNLVDAIDIDRLIPESVSFMRNARAALDK